MQTIRKVLVISFLLAFLTSCTTYKKFVDVKERDIPHGTTEIRVNDSLQTVKNAFIQEGILFETYEGGIITEKRLLDTYNDMTVRVHTKNDSTVIIPFFYSRITKIQNKNRVYVRQNNKYEGEELAFSYLVEILEDNGINDYVFIKADIEKMEKDTTSTKKDSSRKRIRRRL